MFPDYQVFIIGVVENSYTGSTDGLDNLAPVIFLLQVVFILEFVVGEEHYYYYAE